MSDYDAAEKRFHAFHRRWPREGELMDLDFAPVTALVIGKCNGVLYETDDSKKPYLHRFVKTRRPLLVSSSDGSQIYIVKGAYRFTSRGIVG